MSIYFVRHGQTDWNLQQRFQARTDVPLNPTGIAQARAMGEVLGRRGVEFSEAVCSPLKRALETARIILDGAVLRPRPEPAFVEVALGDFEGRFERDLREEHGEAFDRWREEMFVRAAPNGESLAQAARRAEGPLLALADQAVNGEVLIVAHQAINMAMKSILSGTTDRSSLETFRQANDQIDVWDPGMGRLRERIQITAAAHT